MCYRLFHCLQTSLHINCSVSLCLSHARYFLLSEFESGINYCLSPLETSVFVIVVLAQILSLRQPQSFTTLDQRRMLTDLKLKLWSKRYKDTNKFWRTFVKDDFTMCCTNVSLSLTKGMRRLGNITLPAERQKSMLGFIGPGLMT
jgi:hypothetical protein